MDLGLARSVLSPRPGPRRLIIYLPVPLSAVTLSRRRHDMAASCGRDASSCPVVVPSSRLFLDRPRGKLGKSKERLWQNVNCSILTVKTNQMYTVNQQLRDS